MCSWIPALASLGRDDRNRLSSANFPTISRAQNIFIPALAGGFSVLASLLIRGRSREASFERSKDAVAASMLATGSRRPKSCVPGARSARHKRLRVWRFPYPKYGRAGESPRQRWIEGLPKAAWFPHRGSHEASLETPRAGRRETSGTSRQGLHVLSPFAHGPWGPDVPGVPRTPRGCSERDGRCLGRDAAARTSHRVTRPHDQAKEFRCLKIESEKQAAFSP